MLQIPGGWEIVIIIVIIAVLFGGDKAMNSLKSAGRGIYKIKKEVDDIKDITKK
ncbi:MAG: twin-arginine translocase TatA/TatE family subunit [Spirochaetae bacterium HGW-Spirochaetae-1]|jgi:TatA/E family protein of Tat protein translocase|nr:MAG: twin-arginine translocase TatA/TatE family subunit [Spirochaetae bacterium HGW-Spirochaetae-1]